MRLVLDSIPVYGDVQLTNVEDSDDIMNCGSQKVTIVAPT